MTSVFALSPKVKRQLTSIALPLFALLLAACNASKDTITLTESATVTAVKTLKPSATPVPPTESPIPNPTSLPPEKFRSELLREGISPETYIQDECVYLAMRWDPDNALPGTVVAPIMFHSIRPGNEEVSDPSFINEEKFYQIIELAEFFGFETITSEELIAFLYENKAIPQRSMMLIIDDRRPGTAQEYFLPIMKNNDWTTTLAWLVGDTDQRTGLWEWIETLNESGYFDIQSHGFNHIYLTEESNYEDTLEEISGNIPVFQERFGNRPVAYIWPGGNYTDLGIQIARELEYQIGFTVHSRGPIQFNWIPQGEQENAYADPLMTLPRFWSSAALLNLDQALQSSQAAYDFALQNYDIEAEWYQANCGEKLAPLSEIITSE